MYKDKIIKGLTKKQKELLNKGASFEITKNGKLKFIIPEELQNELILEKNKKIFEEEKQKIEAEFLKKIKKITAGYAQEERESWDLKLAEAKKVLAGETSEFLENLVIKGETVEELAQKIVDKAEQYSLAYAQAEKIKRQKLRKLKDKYKE